MKHIYVKPLVKTLVTIFTITLLLIHSTIDLKASIPLSDTTGAFFKPKEGKEQKFIRVLVQGLLKSDFTETIPYYKSPVGLFVFTGDQFLNTKATPALIVEMIKVLLYSLPLYTIEIERGLSRQTNYPIVVLSCTSIRSNSSIRIQFFFDKEKIFKVQIN